MKRLFRLASGIVLSSAILYACVVYYSIELSPNARMGKRNERNSYSVQPGMNATQAFQIMGSRTRGNLTTNGNMLYEYPASPIASNYISIYIDKNSKVVLVGHGD